MKIALHSFKEKKCLALNIAAPFIPQFFKAPLQELFNYTNILVGNEDEAACFAKAFDIKYENISDLALKVSKMSSYDLIVVFTQGINDTIVASKGCVKNYPVISIDPASIVDTNGAGDAFVGGFLSQYTQGFDLDRCVSAGHYVAHTVIQRTGPSYPSEKPNFHF